MGGIRRWTDSSLVGTRTNSVKEKNKSIGIFGGTFDPVHNGHLRVALEAIEQIKLTEVRFVPNSRPSHRAPPVATPTERLQMLRSVIRPPFCVDDIELRRGGVSYMVETLEVLRERYASFSLCLILGRDAFEKLPTWHRAEDVLKLANVVVASREHISHELLPEDLDDFIGNRYSDDTLDLRKNESGKVFLMNIPLLPISSHDLRNRVGRGKSVEHLVPEVLVTSIARVYRK
jgi:nicotinate-nucleotide adenylyltransferase